MAGALQLAFMRCMGCGFEIEKPRRSETVGARDLEEMVVERAGSLADEEGRWWAEPTATFEFEEVPRQFAKQSPKPDAAVQSEPALPTLGPRLGLPPRLPLPLVEEEKAHHWPLGEATAQEEAADASASRGLAARQPGSRHLEGRACESSPGCKDLSGSSSVSTRSTSSRLLSSSSTSMRSGGPDDLTPSWRTRSQKSRLLSEERRPIVCPAIKWRISIDKVKSGADIGLDLLDLPAKKDREGALRIQDIQVPGLVSDWNAAHRSKELKRGDYIVEINGVHGGPDELREVLERDSFLDVMMLRGT